MASNSLLIHHPSSQWKMELCTGSDLPQNSPTIPHGIRRHQAWLPEDTGTCSCCSSNGHLKQQNDCIQFHASSSAWAAKISHERVKRCCQTTEITGKDTEGSCTSDVFCAYACRFQCRTSFSGSKPHGLNLSSQTAEYIPLFFVPGIRKDSYNNFIRSLQHSELCSAVTVKSMHSR